MIRCNHAGLQKESSSIEKGSSRRTELFDESVAEFGIEFERAQEAIAVVFNVSTCCASEEASAGVVEVDEVGFSIFGNEEVDPVKIAMSKIDRAHLVEHFMDVPGHGIRNVFAVIQKVPERWSLAKFGHQDGRGKQEGAFFDQYEGFWSA